MHCCPKTKGTICLCLQMVTLHIVHWGYRKHLPHKPDVAALPLSSLPSISASFNLGRTIARGFVGAEQDGDAVPVCQDWDAVQLEHGATAFMVVPLTLLGRNLGALCISRAEQHCPSAGNPNLNSWEEDSYKKVLQAASEYGGVLSQLLYSMALHREKQAGKQH
jgi:hypothetical protein